MSKQSIISIYHSKGANFYCNITEHLGTNLQRKANLKLGMITEKLQDILGNGANSSKEIHNRGYDASENLGTGQEGSNCSAAGNDRHRRVKNGVE